MMMLMMAALFYSPVDCTDASDMHHSNASLMHRWINRWIKQRSRYDEMVNWYKSWYSHETIKSHNLISKRGLKLLLLNFFHSNIKSACTDVFSSNTSSTICINIFSTKNEYCRTFRPTPLNRDNMLVFSLAQLKPNFNAQSEYAQKYRL